MSDSEAFDLGWLMAKAWPQNENPIGEVRVVDLFAGCGGLSLGVWEACRALGLSMHAAMAVDLDSRTLETFRLNFPEAEIVASAVEELLDGELGAPLTLNERRLRAELGPVDILIGGPPCQGHSDLNNHTRRHDPRNELYLRMARFCEVVHPEHVVIENVPGVLRDKFGSAEKTWNALSGLGYQVSTGTVNAADVGVAQLRKRNFTIASLVIEPSIEQAIADVKAVRRSVDWATLDLLDQYDETTIFDSSPVSTGETLDRINFLFENRIFDLPNEQRPDCHRLKNHSYVSNYGRMRGDRPAQTITTGFGVMGKGRFVNPHERRTITPHEAARIQSFPDFFDFAVVNRTVIQKVIGNAVPPKLGYAVGLHLLR
jgi:DNA (cytosine-5)-methyltransferase 1